LVVLVDFVAVSASVVVGVVVGGVHESTIEVSSIK
jgi:hypothetical protein